MAASHRTALAVWCLVMPTARSSPSSRVRSWIDSDMLLAMLMRAISDGQREQAVHQVDDLVDLRRLGLDVLATGSAGRRWDSRR